MKALFVTLLFPVLLKSCEGLPDQTGHAPITPTNNSGSGGRGTGGTGTNNTGDNTTDVPLDGGLSVLLLTGVAYGVKRYKNNKQKNKDE